MKKLKKMQAMEEKRGVQNKLALAVESVGAALAKSAANRGQAANMSMRMRLIGKAGLPKEEEQAAYKALLQEISGAPIQQAQSVPAGQAEAVPSLVYETGGGSGNASSLAAVSNNTAQASCSGEKADVDDEVLDLSGI